MHAIATEYLDAKKSMLRPASLRVTKLYSARPGVLRAVHAVAAADVTLADVAQRLRTISNNSGTVTASRARAALSAMYQVGDGGGAARTEPGQPGRQHQQSAGLDAARARARRRRDRRRLARLRRRRFRQHHAAADLDRLPARRDRRPALDEIKFEKRALVLPAERVKNKHTLTLPLSDAALRIIRSVPRVLGRDHVFGGRKDQGFTNWPAGAALGERLGGSVTWRIHDIRRTVATKMAEDLGVFPHVVEAVLNHYGGTRAGVAGVYNKAQISGRDARRPGQVGGPLEAIVARPRSGNLVDGC